MGISAKFIQYFYNLIYNDGLQISIKEEMNSSRIHQIRTLPQKAFLKEAKNTVETEKYK